MTERRPGEWPAGLNPAPLAVVPDSGGQPPQDPPRVEVHVPDVRLTAVVDLTGRYASASEVTADLYEQTRRSTDCHTAVVRLGEDALHSSYSLGRAIAAEFFLSAKRIEIEVPSGTRHAYLADEVRRHVRLFCADHAQTMTNLRTPG